MFTAAVAVSAAVSWASGEGADALPRVRVVSPARRAFSDKAFVQGTVRARTSAAVAARTPGAIEALLVEEGASVEAGTPLFRIDRANLENAVRVAEDDILMAEAACAQSEAAVEKTESDRERMTRLVKTGAVSVTDADKAVLAAKTAVAQRMAAQALLAKSRTGLAVAKKNLADTEVRAPFSGTVVKKLKDVGDYASPGAPVFLMEDGEAVEIRFSIDASRYGAVATGKTEIAGRPVAWKSPTVDPATRTFEVRTVAPRSDLVRPGMLVDAEIVFSAADALAVPSSAVNPMPDGRRAVFIVENGRIVRRNISSAAEADGWCAVCDGDLPHDAKVVAEGMLLLHEGDEVVAVEGDGL